MAAPKSVALLDARVQGIEYSLPEVPAEVVYSEGFEAGVGAWGIWFDGAIETSTAEAHTGSASLRLYDADEATASLDLGSLGLINGQTISVSFWALGADGIYLDKGNGAGSGSLSTAMTGEWVHISYTGNYASAARFLNLDAYYSEGDAPVEVYIDDVTITRNAYTPDPLDYLPLEVIDAEITLDDSRSPYAEARLTVHTPAEEYLEQIDPRDGVRVTLEASLSWAEPAGRTPQARTFDLLLHERNIDHETGELSLVLESDEALLIDGGNATATVDDGAEAHQASLRAIVDYVLAKHGAELEVGTDDADFTITANSTNFITNPRLETSSTGYAAVNGTGNRVTGASGAQPTYYRLALTETQSTYYITYTGVSVAVGKTYVASAWVRSSFATEVYIDLFASGTLDSPNNKVAIPANTWVRINTGQITIPSGATAPMVRVVKDSGTPGTSGATLHVTGLRVSEAGLSDTDYFDGASSDAYYAYAWTGTANASSSIRVRLDNRDADALKQAPGVADWDFLDPLVRTAGLRLFCDEQRAWRLVDPSAFRLEGETRISEGVNATRGEDSISLQATRPDGSPVWYTGVVVVYRWTDSEGVQQIAYDAAGTAQKLYRIELARPYPGPGLAAARLAQATGRGRTQDLEALADLGATPGMTLVSTMPATPIQTGVVSAVTWLWAAEGDRHDLMQIRSRGLTDTPETAWVLAEGAWEDVTGIQWNEIDEEGE